jgi:hypothetical protein
MGRGWNRAGHLPRRRANPLPDSCFFRWINQHLRIKQFYGTPENALQTQIWISVCVDVLAIVKR